MVAQHIAYGGIVSAVAAGGVVAAAIDLQGIATIIGAVGGILIGITAIVAPLIVSLITLKRTTALAQAQKTLGTAQQATDDKVVKVGEAVDGKMEALKGLIEKSAHLAGKAEGIAEERADPQTHAVTTVKDDAAAPVPPEASKRC